MTRLNVGNIRHPDGTNDNISLDLNGRVGIGTSSPAELLHVKASGNYGVIIADNNSTTGGGRFAAYQNGSLKGIFGVSGSIEGNTTSDAGLFAETGGAIRFYTNGSPTVKAILDSSGRVGIGTTTPTTKLDIYTGSATGTYVKVENTEGRLFAGVYGTGEGYLATETSDPLILGTNGTERARIDTSGRLLIGTTATSLVSKLNVKARSDDANGNAGLSLLRGSAVSAGDQSLGVVAFLDANENYGASIYSQSEASWTSGSSHPARLVFTTTASGASSPTERVRITQQGFFKATNSNDYYGSTANYHESRNNLAGNVVHLFSHAATSGNNYGIQISYAQNRGTQTGDQYIYCNDTASLRMEVRGNGGIANFQANNVNLSDINTKKDISPAAGTWDCIKEWEIVNYRYKDQPDDADLNLGVIAQQVAESCPEVITVFEEAKDDQPEKLGVKEQQMYWMAIKALQEAQVRIEQLETRLTALEGGTN